MELYQSHTCTREGISYRCAFTGLAASVAHRTESVMWSYFHLLTIKCAAAFTMDCNGQRNSACGLEDAATIVDMADDEGVDKCS